MILSITNAEYRKKFERKKEKQQKKRKNEKRKRQKVLDMSYAMRKRVFFQNENNKFALVQSDHNTAAKPIHVPWLTH